MRDAKALFLVDDDKTQFLELGLFRQDRMRADDDMPSIPEGSSTQVTTLQVDGPCAHDDMNAKQYKQRGLSI